MVKLGQKRARRPGGIRPACLMHAVRLCGTAPGKRPRAVRFAAGRNDGLKERRGRRGLLPCSRPFCPPRGVHPKPPPALYVGILLRAGAVEPGLRPVLPPVLLTRRLPCGGIS